ncbi:MAG TPA: hydrolase [Fibrobacteria bacterium]|nr:hydrolase [Fibrobacteria bacterium]
MFLPEKSHQRNPTLLDAARSLLVVIDVQENFRKAMDDFDALAERIALLAKAAARIGVPILVTEQYRKGLGPTSGSILASVPQGTPVIEKLAFSACDVPEWTAAARASGRNQYVLCGVETHVCVLQTALDLAQDPGASVYVVEDAVASRSPSDRAAALRRLEAHGVQIVTREMVVLEWLRKAGTPEFKELLGWIK